MHYGEILKRAWAITWRNKNLWWLGLFAGAGTSGGFNSGGNNFNSSNFGSGNGSGSGTGGLPFDAAQVQQTLLQFLPLIIAVFAVLVVIWLAFAIIQVAARGGLVAQVAVADDGMRPLASRGWGDGFHRWWPLAIMGAIIALPALLVLLAFAIAIFVVVAIPLFAGSTPSVPALVAIAIAFVGAFLVLIPVSIVLGVLSTLAERGIMLAEEGPWDSLKSAWHLLRSRFKDVALFWLIMLGVGVGFGIVLGLAIVAVVIVLVGIFGGLGFAFSKAIVPIVVMGSIAFIAFMVVVTIVGAAYSTFYSAAWTLFWRRVTGRVVETVPNPQPAAPPAQPAVAEGPPMAPQPPVGPPMAPQPPVAPPMAPPAPPEPPDAPVPPEAPAPPMAPTSDQQ